MICTVLGSGTSTGLPVIGCSCSLCTSPDPKDRRLRSSLLLTVKEKNWIIDTGPDFRAQALRVGLKNLDGVLYTHGHADHVLGLDDLRPLSYRTGVDIWAEQPLLQQLDRMFPYAFVVGDSLNSRPKLRVHEIHAGQRFDAVGLEVLPVRVFHGKDQILGFRIGEMGYVTDCSGLPPASLEQLKGLEVLFLDGLQRTPHPTHLTFEKAVLLARELGAKKTYLTHIGHEIKHQDLQARLPEGVEAAWDGLTIEVN